DRSEPVGVLRAFGNEPFWAVTVGPDSVRLMDLATGDTIAWPSPEPTVASGRPPELARAWVLVAAGPVVLLVRRADDGCSDGMSDNLYPWFALFLRGDRLYEGCARMDDPPVDAPVARASGREGGFRASPYTRALTAARPRFGVLRESESPDLGSLSSPCTWPFEGGVRWRY
ncbi:MAG: hypothetical protein ACRELC_09445, partial [Gemmatimonadota bacterium]